MTGLTAFILVILLSFPVLGTGRLHVTFVDVGQGDCIFIQGPSGRTCLVDGGGKPHTTGSNVGERVVVPFLKSEGLDRLDLMILTHPHDDHMNGLLPVLKELDVKRLIVARAFLTVPEIQPLLDLAAREKVPVIPVARGQEVILDQGLKLRILNPGPAMTVTGGDDMNNNSLVLKMSYGQVSFLFTADTEIECLSSLVESGIDLKADVLKIPHHGSKNSFLPSFYDQVSPRMVVICVGKNTFGHPSGEVVAFWQKQKIPVFRTDLQGAVSLSSDGKDIFVETFKDSSSIKAP